jgi:geranylgeranyl pyrophosphate synthase
MKISDPEALERAQGILVRCGAISYSIHALLERYDAARKTLDSAPIPDKASLESLLSAVIKPVLDLYASLGLPDSGISNGDQISG